MVWSRLARPRLRAEALVAGQAQERPHEPNNPAEMKAHSARFRAVPGVFACGPPLTGSVRRPER
jgi:hypothetical protein